MPYFRPQDFPDPDELQEELFFLAASSDDMDAFCAMLDGGMDPSIQDAYGETPILRALQENSVRVVRALLDRNIELPNDALAIAAGRGHHEIVKDLLARGFHVDERDSQSWTPLMGAALMGHGEVVRLLIQDGAAIDAVDSAGMTALHHAATTGSVEVIGLLLIEGARSDLPDKFGWAPIDWARENQHLAAVRRLAE